MLLRPGDTAPDFDVLDHSGRRVKLSDFHGRMAVVLYFYPKDFTSICTAESCGFRDMYRGLASANVEVVGVSLMSGLDIRYDLGEGHPLLGRRMPDLDVVTGVTRLA